MAESRDRARRTGIGLAIVVLTAALAGCGGGQENPRTQQGPHEAGSADSSRSESTSMSRSEAIGFAELNLPESAHDVQVSAQRGIDQYVAIRFTLPQSDLDAFRRKSNLPEFRKGYKALFPGKSGVLSGWQFDDLPRYSGVSDNTGRPVRNVLAAFSGDNSVTVYVEAFTT